MPERSLDVVISRDGVDTVVSSTPLADKDTVRLHQPDEDHFRAVIRHPRTQYDKVQREVVAGQPETVLVASGAEPDTPDTVDAVEATPTKTRRATKRVSAKKK